jgi:hypothetical protein
MRGKDQLLLEEAYRLICLIESPDIVIGKYDRSNYSFDFFIGDENGTLIKKNTPEIKSHANILGSMKTNKALDIKTYEIVPDNIMKVADEVLGPLKKVNTLYSGIILPKQDDVDATYISFWTRQGYESPVKDLLLKYAKSKYEGPYSIEITDLSTGEIEDVLEDQ